MSEKNNVVGMNVIEGTELPNPLNLTPANNFTVGSTTGTLNSNYYHTYPFSPYSYSYIKTPWVAIEKAENGFIVVKNGQTFVCKNIKEITTLLSKKE